MLWIANVVLSQSNTQENVQYDQAVTPSLTLPRTVTLDSITADTGGLKDVSLMSMNQSRPDVLLHDSTEETQSTAHVASWPKGQKALGQLWQTLGTLILAASEREKDEASFIMSKALSIIAQLHHDGYIPDKVYEVSDLDSQSKPTMISELSLAIMSSLTDAVSDNYMLEDGRISDVNQLSSLKSGGRIDLQLGPELWLEFCLWACLHGGWFVDAAAILTEVKKRRGRNMWHLICWSDFTTSPQSAWADLLKRRLHAQQRSQGSEGAKLLSSGTLHSIERTISTEVVVALVDGMVSGIGSPSLKLHSVPQILERILMLKNLLDRDRMSLGMSTWDEIIARFAEMPEMNVTDNPRLMESVLELAQTYGKERKALNAPLHNKKDSTSADYLFAGTASTIGVYHRTLLAYITRNDINGSIRVLTHLQTLTDNSKKNSLREFFALLKSKSLKKATDVQSLDVSSTKDLMSNKTSTDFPGFFPAIPPVILAGLLDLTVECSSFELGRWMIHSDDVDGPLIAKDQYANQALAPSLIRFAATTNDLDLLANVTISQTGDVSGKTLIALCESRMQAGNWQGAMQVLKMMREHSLHEWALLDLVMVVRVLLQHIKIPISDGTSRQAASLLQQLLRGDMGQVWGSDLAQLDGVVGVLSSIDDQFGDLFTNLLSDLHLSSIDLPTPAFDIILEGAAKSYGSLTGKILWQKWSDRSVVSRKVRNPSTDKTITYAVSPVAEQFSAGHLQSPATSPPLAATFTGYIKPEVSTLRIIAGQALVEARVDPRSTPGTSQKRADEAKETLRWCAAQFRDTFHFRQSDIDAELGHIFEDSSTTPKLYGTDTIKIWQALRQENEAWLSMTEQSIRDFTCGADAHYTVDASAAAERHFLHCLAKDLGLASESFGDEDDRKVTVLKTPQTSAVPPSMTIKEWYGQSQAMDLG